MGGWCVCLARALCFEMTGVWLACETCPGRENCGERFKDRGGEKAQ